MGVLADNVCKHNVTDDDIISDIKYIRDTIWNNTLPETEEATKQWIILPLLKSLGYNIFSSDVIPEYVADFGVKNDEHIDYLVNTVDNECIIIECKSTTVDLNDKHIAQLFRYYTSLVSTGKKIKVAILTNGIDYWFFSDTKTTNIMDNTPIHKLAIKRYSDNELIYFIKYRKYSHLIDKEPNKSKILHLIYLIMSNKHYVSNHKLEIGMRKLYELKQLVCSSTETEICELLDDIKDVLTYVLELFGYSGIVLQGMF